MTADEVFAKYGEAMFRAQVLELSMGNFVIAVLDAEGQALDAKGRQILEADTLGARLKRIEPYIIDEHPLWAGNLRHYIRYRNYLAHRFFLDAGGLQEDEGVRDASFQYLREFERATALASYHMHLLSRALRLPLAPRFGDKIEASMAAAAGVDADTLLKFRRFHPDA
ncbi:MAG: hypothetical protein AAF719_14975 [Pseudomonadota bacterium]